MVTSDTLEALNEAAPDAYDEVLDDLGLKALERIAARDEPIPPHLDEDELPFRVGDPVMDAAQGRPMIVLDVPDLTVEEWSWQNGYDLTKNYGNKKFDVHPREPVAATRYVSDVSGDPDKDYTFPFSRLRLIDAHHADGGRRVYDRIAVDVLVRVFDSMYRYKRMDPDDIRAVADHIGGIDLDAVREARELAEVERVGDDA